MQPVIWKIQRIKKHITSLDAVILPIDNLMKQKATKTLLDIGCSLSLINASLVLKQYWHKLKRPVIFTTKTKSFVVTYKATIVVNLPELSNSKTFEWSFYIDQSKNTMYKIFIGSDIMEHLGINLKYSTNAIQWGDK